MNCRAQMRDAEPADRRGRMLWFNSHVRTHALRRALQLAGKPEDTAGRGDVREGLLPSTSLWPSCQIDQIPPVWGIPRGPSKVQKRLDRKKPNASQQSFRP